MKNNGITEYFEEVETEKEYDGYFCRIPEIITIMILGCMCGLKNVRQIVVADALNCQKETAEVIINQEADYLLSVKDNQPNLKKDIEDFIQEELFKNSMEIISKTEKNYGRT